MSYILFACYGDDEKANKAASFFRKKGRVAVVVPNGEKALEYIAEKSEVPAVIVAHLLMPMLDGLEVAYHFRQTYPNAQTQMLLSTVEASNGEGGIREWGARVEAYLMRPYTVSQLIISVEQLLYRVVTTPPTIAQEKP